MKWKLLLASGFCVFAFMAIGSANEIKVMSPVALKPVLAKVGAEFERSTGHKLAVSWGESGGIKSDIEKGVPFDIAILTAKFVDDLIKEGKLDGDTKTPIARSGIGIAIRKGAPKPDVSTTDALKRTLMDAKSIGYVEHSASSRYLNELLGRLGIADAIKSKLRPLNGPAAKFVANGDPELAITQIGAIHPSEGVELAGPLPPDVQLYTVFVAAAPLNSDAAVRAFLKAMVSPAATSILKETGLEPPN
jgi:molybdate transport system substrate-binding protein